MRSRKSERNDRFRKERSKVNIGGNKIGYRGIREFASPVDHIFSGRLK